MRLIALQKTIDRDIFFAIIINSLVVIMLTYLFLLKTRSINPAEASLAATLLVIIAGYITAPESIQSLARFRLFQWTGVVTGVFFISGFSIYHQAVVTQRVIALSVCVFLILSTLLLCNIILSRFMRDSASRTLVVFFIFVVACTIPFWLGPSLAILSDHHAIVDNSIALSPVTFIASAINMDYLRSDWFYMNSPISGIRYNYPGFTHYVAVQLVILISMYGFISISENVRKQTKKGITK